MHVNLKFAVPFQAFHLWLPVFLCAFVVDFCDLVQILQLELSNKVLHHAIKSWQYLQQLTTLFLFTFQSSTEIYMNHIMHGIYNKALSIQTKTDP